MSKYEDYIKKTLEKLIWKWGRAGREVGPPRNPRIDITLSEIYYALRHLKRLRSKNVTQSTLEYINLIAIPE
jgi:hypothetical protein